MHMIFNESTSDIENISKELDTVIAAYLVSGIPGFVSIGETLSDWKEEIINSFHTYDGRRINNGPIEGRNKYIHILLELTNGYRSFKRFRHRALFVLNKHESPLKEPRETSSIKLPGKERGPYKKKSKNQVEKKVPFLIPFTLSITTHKFKINHTFTLNDF